MSCTALSKLQGASAADNEGSGFSWKTAGFNKDSLLFDFYFFFF